ncbi:alpha/beta-hydrolase [Myriangium duriaei CBS 260.36]|uniref:Alpha/beta-hydrolase n=1 Tax=Myriangium duriaei CBS 260.36 TaxID=1168546 RepID=A0A9P4MDV3_9PEZI|nr:alpha/beta-hydrolase [Myriangium duriaei CBS 260.36]
MGTPEKNNESKFSPPSITMVDVVSTTIFILLVVTGIYFVFLGVLTIGWVQAQVIYLNKVKLTWFKDVNIPEQWGFLHNQVTPFHLHTPDGETLHAWHILPLELYRRHEQALIKEPAGLALDIKSRTCFKLLRNDPDALLVLYLHGAAGTLASGFRPPSYRAISSGASDRIHVLAIDYRGFGTSKGTPSEQGLLTDALTLVNWAMAEADIPANRIVLFSQSLGTAVTASLMHHLAHQPVDPVFFAGTVMVAPFADVQSLTATYKVAGTIPILSPLARFPALMGFFHGFLKTFWPTSEALPAFVRGCEIDPDAASRYHITIIHAKDDYDIPWEHSDKLYWSTVNATLPQSASDEQLEDMKLTGRKDLGAGGWVVDRKTARGVLRQEITEYGLHDRIRAILSWEWRFGEHSIVHILHFLALFENSALQALRSPCLSTERGCATSCGSVSSSQYKS